MATIKQKIICNSKLRTLEASLEYSVSNRITVFPIKQQGFLLDKQYFWNGIYLKYIISLPRLLINFACVHFAILLSCLLCIYGLRSSKHLQNVVANQTDYFVYESKTEI